MLTGVEVIRAVCPIKIRECRTLFVLHQSDVSKHLWRKNLLEMIGQFLRIVHVGADKNIIFFILNQFCDEISKCGQFPAGISKGAFRNIREWIGVDVKCNAKGIPLGSSVKKIYIT
ncbi:hypothetical protein SDC9_147254 [bioreactor metagenome]|uniref:Uncharacterized protein n=1 Tax=bioreactor metagenome TaxID=1076179 RepID=A0A645EFD3_9ZZZZ